MKCSLCVVKYATLQCNVYRTGYDFSCSSGFIDYFENTLKCLIICLILKQVYIITYSAPR